MQLIQLFRKAYKVNCRESLSLYYFFDFFLDGSLAVFFAAAGAGMMKMGSTRETEHFFLPMGLTRRLPS